MSTRRPLLGAALLFVAAVIWGFAFVPQKLTVIDLPPLTATAVRFALAAPIALLVAGRRLVNARLPLRAALWLGSILFVAYALQTAGLVYAPVARVSLITGLYAVFVPLLAPMFRQPKPTRLHWAGALIAFVGLLALTGVIGDKSALETPLNIGDVLVLLHAVISAGQVLIVARVAPKVDPFALNAVQLSVLFALALPSALIIDGFDVLPKIADITSTTWLAFGFLAVFSTVVAFTCQLFAQRHTSAPTSAVIMLLETPIGVVAAVILLHETMALSQWLGAAVLLTGVATSLRAEITRPM